MDPGRTPEKTPQTSHQSSGQPEQITYDSAASAPPMNQRFARTASDLTGLGPWAPRRPATLPQAFVVAPNSIATETNRGESALASGRWQSPIPQSRVNRAPRADFTASP
jgi:hypothetical protein